MSIILDNTLDNFPAWAQEILQGVSRLKYGIHAIHFHRSDAAPVFRQPPDIDDITTHNTYVYEHVVAPHPTSPPTPPRTSPPTSPPTTPRPTPTSTTTPQGIPGILTVPGTQFYREDIKKFSTELEKFEKQGLELFEFIFTRISPSSKLLGKTQHGYSDAVQNTDAHGLFQALSSSHQTSSSTRALSSLVNVFTIRQTSQSHPAVAEEVNHGIQQVKLCWESTLHPGYVSLADLHSALYLNALNPDSYSTIKERILASNPDLRGVDPYSLQQQVQVYTIALDLDSRAPAVALLAESGLPYCINCYLRTKKAGNPKKFTNHGVPGKPPCQGGIVQKKSHANAFLAIAQEQATKANVPIQDVLEHWKASTADS